MRVVGYVRISKADGGSEQFGLRAQRSIVLNEVSARGWAINCVVEDGGRSAKNMRRPGLERALEMLRLGEVDTLVVAKLDRLSRSLMDFCELMDRAKREGWSLVALDMNVDMTTPAGRMVANIMASFAEFERELIAQRTREALAVKMATGWVPGPERCVSAEAEARIFELRGEGVPVRKISSALNREGLLSARGKAWGPSSVQMVLQRAAAA